MRQKVKSNKIIIGILSRRRELEKAKERTLERNKFQLENVMLKILTDLDRRFGFNHIVRFFERFTPITNKYFPHTHVDSEINDQIAILIDEDNFAFLFVELWNFFLKHRNEIRSDDEYRKTCKYNNNSNNNDYIFLIENFWTRTIGQGQLCALREIPNDEKCSGLYEIFAENPHDLIKRTIAYENVKRYNDKVAPLVNLFR